MARQALSFRHYLLRVAAPTDDAAGDFIRDARQEIRDRTFPVVRSWDQLNEHLEDCDACEGAFRSAKTVFERWQRWCESKRTS